MGKEESEGTREKSARRLTVDPKRDRLIGKLAFEARRSMLKLPVTEGKKVRRHLTEKERERWVRSLSEVGEKEEDSRLTRGL